MKSTCRISLKAAGALRLLSGAYGAFADTGPHREDRCADYVSRISATGLRACALDAMARAGAGPDPEGFSARALAAPPGSPSACPQPLSRVAPGPGPGEIAEASFRLLDPAEPALASRPQLPLAPR